MSSQPYYKSGDNNAICDVCGRKFKASALRKRWDGVMACGEDWEPRHSQDFVRAVKDTQVPAFTRPEGEDTFTTFCSLPGRQSIVGFAIAGCWVAGLVSSFDPNAP